MRNYRYSMKMASPICNAEVLSARSCRRSRHSVVMVRCLGRPDPGTNWLSQQSGITQDIELGRDTGYTFVLDGSHLPSTLEFGDSVWLSEECA